MTWQIKRSSDCKKKYLAKKVSKMSKALWINCRNSRLCSLRSQAGGDCAKHAVVSGNYISTMIHQEIGFAGDLFQPSHKHIRLTGGVSAMSIKVLITLSDLFILHDKVYLRADITTLRELFMAIKVDELNVLIENDKIGFYKPYFSYRQNSYSDYETEIEQSLISLKDFFYDETFSVSNAQKLVFDNLIPPKTKETFEDFGELMYDLFYNNELLKDANISMDTQIGFEEGISRIRELWHSGITGINYDWEFHRYLDICNKAAFFKQKELNITVIDPEKSIVDTLHKYQNIPSIAELLITSKTPNKLFLDLITSSEADDFRIWIRTLDQTDIDIRDAYAREIRNLPSKNNWTDWLRFGSVSVVSSILGTVITSNPYLGFLIGTGVSTVDKIYGEKAIDATSKKYNPETWISFIESKS